MTLCKHHSIFSISVPNVYLRRTASIITTHREWTRCANFYTAVMNGRWRKRTSSAFYRYSASQPKTGVLPPYVVRPLTSLGHIDWIRIDKTLSDFSRSEEESIAAVRSASTERDLEDGPMVWCPIYDPLPVLFTNIKSSWSVLRFYAKRWYDRYNRSVQFFISATISVCVGSVWT